MMNYNLLTQCPVFKGIPENESKKFLNEIHFQVKSYTKGDVVAIAGEPVKNLFIVLSGSVKGEMIEYSGKIIKIEDIEAPLPLATAFLFGNENRFPVTVTANNDVRILAIPVSEFLKLMQSNTQILVNYLNSISSRSQFLTQKLQFLNFKTIREKVAHFLLQRIGDRLHSFELNTTQQQLAELLGVTRPAMARVLSEMQREKLFKIEKKTVTILNRKKLNEVLKNA
ncbi:MAG: Crp/Fnr family transcriptional regulator [Mariniphaga sp.]|nr:Crp/Fnr family transcriptional regulator [Mariniphaga sp.]